MARYQCPDCGAHFHSKCAFQRSVFWDGEEETKRPPASMYSRLFGVEIESVREDMWRVKFSYIMHSPEGPPKAADALAKMMKSVEVFGVDRAQQLFCEHPKLQIMPGQTCDFGCCVGDPE